LPLQLFLVANVTDAKIFSTPLDQHLHNDIGGGVAQRSVAHRLETRRTTQAIFAPIFNQTVALNAKSLIVLMVFPFTLLPALVFYRSRCFPCTSMLPAAAPDRLFGGPGLESASFDHALSITELIACAIYLYIAAGNAYGARGVARVSRFCRLSWP